MGKSLVERFDVARQVFDQADLALRCSLTQLCFEAQRSPADYREYSARAADGFHRGSTRLDSQGVSPDYVAGHSLGEYSALVAAGSLAFADAVRLVRKRGQYMQEAVPAGVGAMAALLKLPEGKLDAILEEAAQGEVVSAANLNSPDQIVIAGHAGAVNRAWISLKLPERDARYYFP